MTSRARAKHLTYLEQRRIVAMLNSLKWAEYAMSLLQEQLVLAKEGAHRQVVAARIRNLRAKGLLQVAREDRDEQRIGQACSAHEVSLARKSRR